jgi:hypothetical protein
VAEKIDSRVLPFLPKKGKPILDPPKPMPEPLSGLRITVTVSKPEPEPPERA